MLVLTRRPGQWVKIGDNIFIKVESVVGQRVKLAIEAPREVAILRDDIKVALAAGVPLHEIEDKLDWRDNQENSDV